MRSSGSFHKDSDQGSDSQSELPKEWDYLSTRLAQIEKGLTILQKKHRKIEKKLGVHINDTNQFNTEITEQLLQVKANGLSKLDVKQVILKECFSIEKEIRNACSQDISKSIDHLTRNFYDKNDSIEVKIKTVYDQSKTYVDRAVFELKEILKKYVKQQSVLQRKVERSSRENSPAGLPRNSLAKSKSAKRLLENTTKSQSLEKMGESRQNLLEKSRENLNKQSTSRVSYLRQKLKQFQKINKKYETDNQRPAQKQGKDDVIKKMKNYHQFLEQSESEQEPSNFLAYDELSSYASAKKGGYQPY